VSGNEGRSKEIKFTPVNERAVLDEERNPVPVESSMSYEYKASKQLLVADRGKTWLTVSMCISTYRKAEWSSEGIIGKNAQVGSPPSRRRVYLLASCLLIVMKQRC
jgi:hypothetical protein